ncbi:MAG TPA: FHA domain-containing protein [Deinococcales bacterium]|nr:FHA domain-containing protein [Deinococcales bacterium]
MTTTQARAPRRAPARYWRPLLVGAAGGLLGFLLSEPLNQSLDGLGLIPSTAIWGAILSLGVGVVLVAFDNIAAMRGRWSKDLPRGLVGFAAAGLVASGLAQWYYQSSSTSSLERGFGWAIFGAGIGVVLGWLRRDLGLAWRGVLGGAAGGFLGGLAFNSISAVASVGNGTVSRAFGLIVLGAAIAVCLQLAQQVFRAASLMGLTTGPLEGREFPLTKAAVTVGRAERQDISLYREASLPPNLGTLNYAQGRWTWRGAPIPINDQPAAERELKDGDVLQFGTTRFLFSLGAPAPRESPAAQPARPLAQGPAPFPQVQPGVPVPQPVAYLPPAAARSWRLGGHALPPGTTTVGRGPENDLVLADPTVSTRHAVLETGPDGVTVTDLQSTNGTLLNGRALVAGQPAPARVGDEIAFGAVRLRVEPG